jgi:hypothetical protein
VVSTEFAPFKNISFGGTSRPSGNEQDGQDGRVPLTLCEETERPTGHRSSHSMQLLLGSATSPLTSGTV